MEFFNVYEDAKRAEAYSKLEFPSTYYLAYRDLPKIILEYVKGRKAIDFGCGTGRSTRFLQKLRFDVIGVDIAEDMIKKARELDPKGDYRLIEDGDFSQFKIMLTILCYRYLHLIMYLQWKRRLRISEDLGFC